MEVFYTFVVCLAIFFAGIFTQAWLFPVPKRGAKGRFVKGYLRRC